MSDEPIFNLDLGATIRGLTIGQRVCGRYVLERILGRGGMGIVWLARDEKLGRDVALKFLPDLVLHDRLALDQLKNETNRSLELTHPHIVRVYDFVQDGNAAAAIAMEFVDGDNLSDLRVERKDRHFEVAELKPLIAQLCEALTYAHERAKIAHRDLKPANLMLNRAGELKVADFGIASTLSETVSRVSLRPTAGTLVYMSPQQLDGEQASALDDIYAVGATLYDLLSSKPPFTSVILIDKSEKRFLRRSQRVAVSLASRVTKCRLRGSKRLQLVFPNRQLIGRRAHGKSPNV